MPRVSVWLVRSALVYLALGASLGSLLLARKAGWWLLGAGPWVSIHRELLLVGWLVQLAIGVGFWILPPVRGAAIRKRPAWTVAGLLNGGLVLFTVGAVWADSAGVVTGSLPALGRTLEGLAVVGFAVPLLGKSFR